MADMNQTSAANDSGGAHVDEVTMMRLVDGEVTFAERMEILERLEQQAGGWRECALAFLEDQVWRQAMTEPVASGAETSDGVALAKATDLKQAPTRSSWSLGTIATLAAGLLLAFLAGSWTTGGDGRDIVTNSGGGELIADAAAPDASSNDANDRNLPELQPLAANKVGNADGVSPVYVIDNEFWDHETSVPQDFQKKLESIGAKIERKRGLMPVRANDGREWIVPYEELNVVPVRDVSL